MMFERKRYRKIGFNMNYPFNEGDLRDCGKILSKYIENLVSTVVPFDDLK